MIRDTYPTPDTSPPSRQARHSSVGRHSRSQPDTIRDWPDMPCPNCGGDSHTYVCVSTWNRCLEQHYPDCRDPGPCPRCTCAVRGVVGALHDAENLDP
jgi:hypothetical protein